MEGLEALCLGVLEAEQSRRVANIVEEQNRGHRDDEEADGEDLVQILGRPRGEIEALGLGEPMVLMQGREGRSDLGLGRFGSGRRRPVLDQHFHGELKRRTEQIALALSTPVQLEVNLKFDSKVNDATKTTS